MTNMADDIRAHLSPVPTVEEWYPWMLRTRAAILAAVDMWEDPDEVDDDEDVNVSYAQTIDDVVSAMAAALGVRATRERH